MHETWVWSPGEDKGYALQYSGLENSMDRTWVSCITDRVFTTEPPGKRSPHHDLIYQFSSVQFSCSVVRPHESQYTRPPCPSTTPRVHSDSHASSQWCHPAISSSVIPFSSCPQSLPASESFPMSQLFARGGQSTGVSALASFLPKKTLCWSPSE